MEFTSVWSFSLWSSSLPIQDAVIISKPLVELGWIGGWYELSRTLSRG